MINETGKKQEAMVRKWGGNEEKIGREGGEEGYGKGSESREKSGREKRREVIRG